MVFNATFINISVISWRLFVSLLEVLEYPDKKVCHTGGNRTHNGGSGNSKR